jgi:hypothetical protein
MPMIDVYAPGDLFSDGADREITIQTINPGAYDTDSTIEWPTRRTTGMTTPFISPIRATYGPISPPS